MTDFLIQKLPDRGSYYHREPGIWYSSEINRWLVTAPELDTSGDARRRLRRPELRRLVRWPASSASTFII